MQNGFIDLVTLTFDILTPKAHHFEYVLRSFHTLSLNTFGLFVFELCCGQTDRQTDCTEHATHADRQSPDNRVITFLFQRQRENAVSFQNAMVTAWSVDAAIYTVLAFSIHGFELIMLVSGARAFKNNKRLNSVNSSKRLMLFSAKLDGSPLKK